MKIWLWFGIFFLGVLSSVLSGGAFAQDSKLDKPPPIRGMALGLFSKDPSYTYQKDLREIKALGCNTILLPIPWYQRDIYSNVISPRFRIEEEISTFPDDRLTEIIQASHQLRLKVLLSPYLRFEHRAPEEWRGVLAPRDFRVWAKQYEKFILHYARLAQRHRVELFSIGSELGSLEGNEKFWKDLIAKVRKKYRGKLIYSVNWDHYIHPTFWGDLDAIGISSYYRLSHRNQPDLAELKSRWLLLKEKILKFLSRYPDKKIIFTEVGYPSYDGAGQTPWDYVLSKEVDTEEQALCYRSFMEVWNDTPQLQGIFWWIWFGPGGEQDKDYTPRNKPAAEWIKKWFLKNPRK